MVAESQSPSRSQPYSRPHPYHLAASHSHSHSHTHSHAHTNSHSSLPSHHLSPVLHTALELGFDVGAAALAFASPHHSQHGHGQQLGGEYTGSGRESVLPAGSGPARSPVSPTSGGGASTSPSASASIVNGRGAGGNAAAGGSASGSTSTSTPNTNPSTATNTATDPSTRTSTSTPAAPLRALPASSAGVGPLRRPRARKQRYSRSRTGCLTCRARKVKCDERHPVCTRCLDLEIECQWPDPSFLAYKPRSRRANDGDTAGGGGGGGSGDDDALGFEPFGNHGHTHQGPGAPGTGAGAPIGMTTGMTSGIGAAGGGLGSAGAVLVSASASAPAPAPTSSASASASAAGLVSGGRRATSAATSTLASVGPALAPAPAAASSAAPARAASSSSALSTSARIALAAAAARQPRMHVVPATRVRAPGMTPTLTAAPAPASLMPPPPVVPIASVPSFQPLPRSTSSAATPQTPHTALASLVPPKPAQAVSPVSSRGGGGRGSPTASDTDSERWAAISDTNSLLGGFSLPGIGLVAGSSSAAGAAAAAATAASTSAVSLASFNPVALLHSLARHPIPGSSTSPTATTSASIAPLSDTGQPLDPSTSSSSNATSDQQHQQQQQQQQHSNPRISIESSALARRRRTKDTKPAIPSFNIDLNTLAQLDASALASFAAPLMHSPDPLAFAFPSPSSRRLFHHFVSLTSSIVVAMSTVCGPDKKSRNPILNVALPLIVHDADSPARAAFRLGILSLAAGHMHHQYLVHGTSASPDAASMLVETRRARRHADAQMLLSLTRQGDAELDLVLATCMMLKTRDVVLADKGWKKNLDFALRLILQRGGAVALLAADPHNFSRRFVIEQLATSDVFSTFTTGDEPTLLGHDAPWWLESQMCASTEWQWDAYEHQFGLSRGMAEMVAKCRVIAYRKDRVLEAVAVACGGAVSSPASDISNLEIDPEIAAIADAIDAEAWQLLEQLRVWSIAQQHVPQHSRVLLGDSAYRYAMVVMLLHEVLGVPAADERVQTAVKCVLELCAEISMEPVMLVWPLLIAGARAKGEDREWVTNLFDIFKKDHCTDLMTAQTLLSEQWRRLDEGMAFTPWPQLMREMDLVVLLI